jgi:hypothetical protein
VRVFKTKAFDRFATRERIGDAELYDSIAAANAGRVDADLGGGVIKQRIARSGQGKSGGFRTIVLFQKGQIAFFVYGFAKNERDNIRGDELRAFRALAKEMLSYEDGALEAATRNGTLKEIKLNA